jgi:hypothetical protein
MAGPKGLLPDDGIYRAILIVLVVSLLAGVAITLVGEYMLRSQPVSQAGAWLAIVSGAIYFFFRWIGRRETRRRADEREAQHRARREPGDDDPQDSSGPGR